MQSVIFRHHWRRKNGGHKRADSVIMGKAFRCAIGMHRERGKRRVKIGKIGLAILGVRDKVNANFSPSFL